MTDSTTEWVKKASENLDKLHAYWLDAKDANATALEKGCKTIVPAYLDHKVVLSGNERSLRDNKTAFLQDCDLLKHYLSELKSGSLGNGKYVIGGESVSKSDFVQCRQAAVAELNYKTQLLRYTKSALERKKLNAIKRSAWKNRNQPREERIKSFNSTFVNVAKEILSRDVFDVLISETERRQKTLGG